jgi:glycosyltransferase involved in cell wall biosynthesis
VKILVNAVSLKEGGPLVVLDQLLGHMIRLRPDIDWAIAVHLSAGRRWNGLGNVTEIEASGIDAGALGVPRWYEIALPAAVKRTKADLVFSITNYLPVHRLSTPTVLLVQHAGHFSPKFDEFMCRYLRRPDRIAAWRMKTAWVERSVRTASEVTVQTNALAGAIAARTGRSRKHIHVIPHGPGAVRAATPREQPPPFMRPVRIGYITKWGVQKNFEVLFAAATRLIEEGRVVRILLTLNTDLPENAALMRQPTAAGLGRVIENLGEVRSEDISALYDSLDVFAYPSLVESFGFTLIEAMARGLPIAAADTTRNREIAKDAALYFPATDADALAGLLRTLIDDAPLRAAHSAAAINRARDFSWHRAAVCTLAVFDVALSSASNHGCALAQI